MLVEEVILRQPLDWLVVPGAVTQTLSWVVGLEFLLSLGLIGSRQAGTVNDGHRSILFASNDVS